MKMKRRIQLAILLILIGISSVSCVSKKKYAELENLKNNIQGLLDENQETLTDTEKETSTLQAQLDDCELEKNRLQRAAEGKGKEMESLKGEMDSLSTSCEDLGSRYKQLKTQSARKIQDLIDELETLQADLAVRERKLKQLEHELNRRDSALSALRNSMNEALLGFAGDEISVERKDGKVYVTLTNELLFESGSTDIDEKGKEALNELGKALASQSELTVWVEGHTDDMRVSNLGDIKDNWDLSVMRSTEVVRILVEAGVDPQHILPSGRGQSTPKVEGSTPEARAQNRRTEIILSPKWDLLYELVKEEE